MITSGFSIQFSCFALISLFVSDFRVILKMGSNPVEYRTLTEEELKHLKKFASHFGGERFVKVGPEEIVIFPSFLDCYDRAKGFQLRENDVWVVTYPKSGTTLSQELLWCLVNDNDFETARSGSIYSRSIYFERQAAYSRCPPETLEKLGMDIRSFDLAESFPMDKRRVIKSHLPLQLLPDQIEKVLGKEEKGVKVIYVARDPRDVCVSYFHYMKAVAGYEGSLEEFVDAFLAGNLLFMPYVNHVEQFWKRRESPNLLIVKYEDMVEDMENVIKKCGKFLGKVLKEEDVRALKDHLSFDKMKANPAVNKEAHTSQGNDPSFSFMRKGKIGSYKEELSGEVLEKLEKWHESNRIEGLY